MIDHQLLKDLRCPETLQTLSLASPETLQHLNLQIAQRTLRNRGGALVESPLPGGLIRADGKVLYPIRQQPIMLIEESLRLSE